MKLRDKSPLLSYKICPYCRERVVYLRGDNPQCYCGWPFAQQLGTKRMHHDPAIDLEKDATEYFEASHKARATWADREGLVEDDEGWRNEVTD